MFAKMKWDSHRETGTVTGTVTRDSKEFEAVTLDLIDDQSGDDVKVSSANALVLWLLMSGLGWLTVVAGFFALS